MSVIPENTAWARVYAECPACGSFFRWFDDEAVDAHLADFPTQPLALVCPRCDTAFIPETLVDLV
jgi:hypothetical protein